MRFLLVFIVFLFCISACAYAEPVKIYSPDNTSGAEGSLTGISPYDADMYSGYPEYFISHARDNQVTEATATTNTVQTDAVSFIAWEKCLGGSSDERASDIARTDDGGYGLSGYTYSDDGDVSGNHGNYDFWVVKVVDTGDIVWEKCLGGSDDDEAFSIAATNDGGYIATGYTYSDDGDVSGNHGEYDFWVVNLDPAGEIIWEKCFGGTDWDMAHNIQKTDDGGYILAGSTYSNDGDVSGKHGNEQYPDGWVVKISVAGGIEWQRCLGGTDYDSITDVMQTQDGGYMVAGYTFSDDGDVTNNHGNGDCWVVKLSDAGEIIWQKCLGGTAYDNGKCIVDTGDGGYIVAGFTQSDDGDVSGNHGKSDCWVVKLSDAGEIVWQKCLGGAEWDSTTGIEWTIDGGYIMAGYTRSNDGDVTGNHGGSDYWMVKLSDTGGIEWQRCLGGSDDEIAGNVLRVPDWQYIVVGSSDSDDGDVTANHGSGDYWIVQMTEVLDPVASFNADPTHGIAPLLVQFLDTSTGSPASWNWTFDDGSTGSDQNPLHEFTQPGSYNVSLNVSNAAGSNTSYITIPVLDPETGMYLPLEPGWNLVSVSRYPAAGQDTIGTLFGGVISSGHSIFMFNATAQSWNVPQASHSITPLEAYFVYSEDPVEITVTYASKQADPEKLLMPTWNQMGYSDIEPEETGLYLSPLQDAWTFILGFDAVHQKYEETIIRGGTGPYSDSRLMSPGSGYWLYSEEEIVFHPSS